MWDAGVVSKLHYTKKTCLDYNKQYDNMMLLHTEGDIIFYATPYHVNTAVHV